MICNEKLHNCIVHQYYRDNQLKDEMGREYNAHWSWVGNLKGRYYTEHAEINGRVIVTLQLHGALASCYCCCITPLKGLRISYYSSHEG
jgi:hypothetical protein